MGRAWDHRVMRSAWVQFMNTQLKRTGSLFPQFKCDSNELEEWVRFTLICTLYKRSLNSGAEFTKTDDTDRNLIDAWKRLRSNLRQRIVGCSINIFYIGKKMLSHLIYAFLNGSEGYLLSGFCIFAERLHRQSACDKIELPVILHNPIITAGHLTFSISLKTHLYRPFYWDKLLAY